MTILFSSNQPYMRAENIRALMEGYPGEKEFIQVNPWQPNPNLWSKRFAIRVTDEFIGRSPGKAVMIGHGIAGGKTYGLDQPRPYHNRERAKLLNYVITTSREMVPLVAKQSGVPEDRVLPLGMPRTDGYFGKSKGDGRTVLSGKRAYLYAPTFHGKGEGSAPDIDWEYIDGQLQDDEIFAVKPHMVTKHLLPHRNFRHIIELSYNNPSRDYLIDCDVLITDYSSIMFDAHVLEKPVVLFEKRKGYTDSRGMYLPYPDGYASRYCRSEDDLIHLCRTADEPGAEDILCRELTAGACDGHSVERIVKLLESML